MYTLELYVTEGERKCARGIYECHHFYVHYTQSKLPPCVCVGILAAAGCLRWLQYKLLFVCDKWTWRKTPPQSYGYLFKGGLHSNQQIHRKGLPILRHKKVQKKGPLTFIHSLLAADTQHKRWMNWTGSRCWSSATSYTQAWMMVGSVSCGERDISKSIRSFFLYRLMKIIVECCRMISWLDL